MLRLRDKQNLIRIIKNIESMCKNGLQKDDATLLSVLQIAQESMVTITSKIEKELEGSGEAVTLVETLCETFYSFSQNLGKREKYNIRIFTLLEEFRTFVSNFSTTYQIVFFPYKADMWDSLESIWLACKDDPRCECLVVPIPYYSYDAVKDEWVYCYEGDRFPSYVFVTNYTDYDLTECADVAFIHNPYDEYNYVTRVHKDYFSYNLKKYVKNLFYVPYFVSSGSVSKHQKQVSVYQHADYFMLQSESFKEGLKEYDYYNKAVVVGSPKLDRVIRLCKEGGVISEEWRRILSNRKSLLLNTSIAQFLHDGEAYLQKLFYIFKVVQNRKDVVIVWRPHPLLRSTIESMRPHLLDTYLELQRFFMEEKIGILDNTSDVTNTVAIVDGYMGEELSSIVNLFELAGKPLFILSNYITEDSCDQEQKELLTDCEKKGEDYYCISAECNKLYLVKHQKWECMKELSTIGNVPQWLNSFSKTAKDERRIYFSPFRAEEFMCYDIEKGEVQQISDIHEKEMLSYRFVTVYRNKVFYLPNVTKCIAEYDVEKKTWTKYYEPIEALQNNISEYIYEDLYGYYVKDNYMWMTNLYSNRVLQFDMETGIYRLYEVGDKFSRYVAVAVDAKRLYLSNACSGEISVWNLLSMKKENVYEMPESAQAFKNVQGRDIAHDRLYIIGNYLFAVPRYASALVRINLQTGKTEIVAEEFWDDVRKPAFDYKAEAKAVVSMVKMVDENTLLIQKRRDGSLLELNVHTCEYKIHHPKLVPGEREKMLQGADGFEKDYTNGKFARRESKYFSLEGFLDDLVNDRFGDVMARQREAMKTIAVNLDGTCGEKVHEFMMQILQNN